MKEGMTETALLSIRLTVPLNNITADRTMQYVYSNLYVMPVCRYVRTRVHARGTINQGETNESIDVTAVCVIPTHVCFVFPNDSTAGRVDLVWLRRLKG